MAETISWTELLLLHMPQSVLQPTTLLEFEFVDESESSCISSTASSIRAARHGVEDLVSLGARCRLPAAPWSLGPGKLMSTFVRRLRRWWWSPSPLSHDLLVLRHDDRKTQCF